MKINLHIERLVLEGVPVTRTDGPLVQAAVQAELGRLLIDGGLSRTLLTDSAVPHVSAQAIQLTGGVNAPVLGRQIAQSVYGGIGK